MQPVTKDNQMYFLRLLYFFADSSNKNGYSQKDIIDKLPVKKANGEEFGETSVKNKLKKFTELGYLSLRDKLYYISESVFKDLDEEELYMLSAFMDFCRDVFPPSIMAHYLMYSVKMNALYNYPDFSYDSVFLFKHLHIGQVLDDYVLCKLIKAVSDRKQVKFKYKQKDNKDSIESSCPNKIIINESDGREYMFGADTQKNYRIDRIFDLNTEKKTCPISKEEAEKIYKSHNKPNHTVKLIYNIELEGHIKSKFPDFSAQKYDDKHNFAEIKVNSVRNLKPWLRQHIGKICLEESSDKSVKEELEEELKEWRKIYDIRR